MKRILLMCVGLLLLLTTGIGGTLAMSAAESEGVSGVSTGQVNIKLLQEMRSDEGLEDFIFSNLVDKNVIYPAYSPNENRVCETYEIEGKPYSFWKKDSVVGAIDHIVRVKNAFLFNSDAYVRVFVAFEGGAENVLVNCNTADWEWSPVIKDVQITTHNDSNVNYTSTYDVYVATYKTVLEKGKTTEPCLLQMALNGAETDHDFFAKVGLTYETLVYAQAVEARSEFGSVDNAFATAFGSVTENPGEFFSSINWAASSGS